MEKLIYENERGMKVELKNSRPFILTKIEGIGGLNSEIIETRVPYQDGSSYHNSRLEPRIITIYGGIMGADKTNRYARREELIKTFNPKLLGKLTYKNDYLERSIDCRVQVAPVWNNGVKRLQEFMIQLYCNNPFFFDLIEDKEEIALWRSTWEFPVEISEEGMEFGYREMDLITNIYNKGDVSCGMRIEFHASAFVDKPSLINVYTREHIKVNRSLDTGDRLVITTGFGNNTVRIYRVDGTVENALHYITLDSEFLLLGVGDNVIQYDAESGKDNLDVSIYHKPMYLGV